MHVYIVLIHELTALSTRLPSRGLATHAPTVSSTADALAAIRSQPQHYVVASVAGKKYLLAPKDLLTVPRLKDVKVGDVLDLSDVHEVGSREFTLRGEPTFPAGTVSVTATVVEHTKGALERITKFKRRKGYKKVVLHKQPYTRLRIGPIHLGSALPPLAPSSLVSASAPTPTSSLDLIA
jgi:large subunit ribosomal protein L21